MIMQGANWRTVASNSLLVLFAVVAMQLASPRVAFCQLPSHVATALAENAKGINGCKAEWTTKRTSSIPLPTLARTLEFFPPCANADHFSQEESAYSAIDNGRVLARFSYLFPNINLPGPTNGESESKGGNNIHLGEHLLHVDEYAFDGTHIFTGKPVNGELPAMLMVSNRDKALKEAMMNGVEQDNCEVWRSNYWRAAGFEVPTNVFDYQSPAVQSSVLKAASIRGSVVEFSNTKLAGQEVARVDISAFGRGDVFYLDPKCHYAMLKHEQFDEQSRLISTTVSRKHERVETSTELYLPQEVDVAYCQLNGRPKVPTIGPLITRHYTLKSCKAANFTDADFQLNYGHKPGMRIQDDRLAATSAVSIEEGTAR